MRLPAHLLTLLALGAGLALAADFDIRLVDPPLEVQEGRKFTLKLAYTVPEERGTVPLRCELKNTQHVVLEGQRAEVKGKGEVELEFTAPRRADEKVIFFALWFGEDWREALAPIKQTEETPIVTAAQVAQREAQRRDAETWLQRHRDELAPQGNVAVLDDDVPGLDRRVLDAVQARLKAAGLPVVGLDAAAVSNVNLLTAERFDTLVLTQSAVFPADGGAAIDRFLRAGGNLIALGAPAFTNPVIRLNDRWLTATDIRETLASVKAERVIWDFEAGDRDDFRRASNQEGPSALSFEGGGAAGSARCLRASIANLTGWETYVLPAVESPFAAGHELTTFWAKGAQQTTQLALEWAERDGSRWIATVNLKPEWTYYVLAPEEFHFWQDSPTADRGKEGDRLHPENAERFTIGLAFTHTHIGGGRHEFWIDQIGTAPNPFGDIPRVAALELAPIEMVHPTYKFHPVTNAADVRVSDKQALLPAAKLNVPGQLSSVHARPQATGYLKARKWRFIPLLEAFEESGEVAGTPAAMVLHRMDRYPNAITVSFAVGDPQFYLQTEVLEAIATLAQRLRRGAFLWEGGAQYYAYFQGEEVRLGAELATLGEDKPDRPRVRFTVRVGDQQAFGETVPIQDGRAETTWRPGRFEAQEYSVTAELLVGDDVLDMLRHALLVWEPPAKPNYMTIRDGGFWLDGKPWYAHGTNYMPSTEIGIEDHQYFEFWLDPQPYDPVPIERDLRRVKAMGMNMVSVFCYYRSLKSRNLLDLLARCERNGLKVNLSLRPGTPLDFRWDEMRALIEEYRLAENDTVFAYDLAWEPHWRGYDQRRRWDSAWESWIIEHYGSLESAERDWGFAVPRADGKVTSPSNEQVSKDGDWRVMVAAYRRFLDDLLDKAHARANGLVKGIDPHHPTSFRMSIAGDPTCNPASMGYDFRGLARTVDIMQPEGYGRIGDWERVKPGAFASTYSRAVAPGRPVLWAEFGYTVWDGGRMAPDEGRVEFAGNYYNDFHRMIELSDANGSINWFYPGGYRYNERSDYGIANPDGTWRPTSRAIRDWSERLTRPRPVREPTVWIDIDRDRHPDGIHGIYEEIKDEYWAAWDTGGVPGFRTSGHGLTSQTAPPIAVGNTEYTGDNPHKHLNATFDSIAILNADGQWQQVERGDTVKVTRGGPLKARAIIGNTREAKWIAGDDEGCVFLSCREPSTVSFRQPLPADVEYLATIALDEFVAVEAITKQETVVFEMTALNRAWFGERINVTITP